MAESKKILGRELVDVREAIEDLTKMESVIKDIKKAAVDTLKDTKKILESNAGKATTQAIDETTKALTESTTQRKLLIEVERAEIKLQEDRIRLEQIQNKLLLQQAKDADKALKAQEKEEAARKAMNSEYAKAQKRLTELSKTQRDLFIKQELGTKLTKAETKELKALTDQIQKLDKALKAADESQGKFQRDVGNYEKATKGLRAAQQKGGGFLFGLGAGIAGAQISKGIDEIFAGTAEKAENFQLILERTFNLISNIGVAVKNFIVGYAIPQIDNFTLKIEKLFTTSLTKDGRARLAEINKQLEENNKTLESFKDPFDGIVDRVKETDKLTREQVKLRFQLIRSENELAKAIQDRIGREQVLAQIAEDDTLGFTTRLKAGKQLFEVEKSRRELETGLANKQLEIQTKIVRIGLEKEGLGKKFTDEQIRSLEFLQDEEAFRKTNIEDLEKLKTAVTTLNQLEIDNQIFQAERGEKDRKARLDLLETTLDNQKDIFDKVQAFNAAIINNDRLTLATRRKVLEENIRLGDKSFEDQNKSLNAYIQDRVANDKNLTAAEKKSYLERMKLELDLNELVKINDGQEIDNRLASLNLAEKEKLLIKQSLTERKAAEKDRADEQKTLDDARREVNNRITESERSRVQNESDFKIAQLERQYNKESEIQEAAFIFRAKKLKDINKLEEAEKQAQLLRDFDAEKKNIDATIVEEDERAQKIKEIREKLEQDLQNLSLDTAEKQRQLNRQQFLSELDYYGGKANDFLEALESELEKENALRQEYLDKQIDQRQNNINQQMQLFMSGQKNQLAFEQEQLAKQELQRKDAEEKAQKQRELIQLSEAYLQAYIARLKQPNADPANSAIRAAGDTLLAKGLAKAVAGFFYDGTEKVEDDLKGNKVHNGRDGYLIAVDGKERIMNPLQNSMIPAWMDNDMLAQVAYDYSRGSLANNINESMYLQPVFISKIDELIKVIKAQPTTQLGLNEFGRITEKVSKNNMTTKRSLNWGK